METQNLISGNTSLLKQFAVKSNYKEVLYGDRAITYNRCSSKKQDSVGWQAKITGEFVSQKNWILVKAFGVKESAKTSDGKVFLEMLDFCRKEHISHIVFFSYDRFSRSGNDSLLDSLRNEGIKVHAATQTVDDSTPSGRFSQSMYVKFARLENEQRREKILAGMKNKLRKGEIITAAPIGYDKRFVNGKKEHEFEKPQCFINETGKLIRLAFYWKANENITNLEIIRRLKNMGLTLEPPELTRIFRNIFYCGYITNKLLDAGEIIRGKHEPLVDEATFLRVNGITSKNPQGWKAGKFNDEMPLKTIARCGKCDRPLTAYQRKGIYVYYKCPNAGCGVNISGKKLHKLFNAELFKLKVSDQLIPVVRNQLEQVYLMLHNNETIREKPMKDEFARLKNELEVMELNLATGKLPLQLFEKHSEAHKAKITSIEADLKTLVRDSSNLGLYLDKHLHFIRNLPEIWEKLDFAGKARLQKLVYPAGLNYMPENHTLQTNSINPVFSAITTISTLLAAQEGQQDCVETEKLRQVYLGFPSSNFLWENLEKTAVALEELKCQLAFLQKPVVSMTGETPTSMHFYSSNSTQIPNTNTRISELFPGISSSYTGTTNQQLTRQ